jgi:hypothetical protein
MDDAITTTRKGRYTAIYGKNRGIRVHVRYTVYSVYRRYTAVPALLMCPVAAEKSVTSSLRTSPASLMHGSLLMSPLCALDGRQSRSAVKSLHRKFSSPERRKREPEELRQAAKEKHLRAERTRQQLEADRKARLKKVCCHFEPCAS